MNGCICNIRLDLPTESFDICIGHVNNMIPFEDKGNEINVLLYFHFQ